MKSDSGSAPVSGTPTPLFTRYVVKPYPSWGKKEWGVWDRLSESWYEREITRYEGWRIVAQINGELA